MLVFLFFSFLFHFYWVYFSFGATCMGAPPDLMLRSMWGTVAGIWFSHRPSKISSLFSSSLMVFLKAPDTLGIPPIPHHREQICLSLWNSGRCCAPGNEESRSGVPEWPQRNSFLWELIQLPVSRQSEHLGESPDPHGAVHWHRARISLGDCIVYVLCGLLYGSKGWNTECIVWEALSCSPSAARSHEY